MELSSQGSIGARGRSVLDGGVQGVLDRYTRAIYARDIDAMMELFTDDVVASDLMMPFQFSGKDVLRKRLLMWLDGYESNVDFTFHEAKIFASGDLAICSSLAKSSGKVKGKPGGSMWIRCTLAFRKEDGEWRIFHEHSSDPIDMETGKALFQIN